VCECDAVHVPSGRRSAVRIEPRAGLDLAVGEVPAPKRQALRLVDESAVVVRVRGLLCELRPETSGRWRVKLRDPTRPGRWMPGGSFATRAEAVDYRNGLLAILAGVLRDAELVDEGSLQSFGDAWLDERELAGDCRSVDTFRSQWRHVSGSELAKKLLRDITAVDVRAWLDVAAIEAVNSASECAATAATAATGGDCA